MPTVAIDRQEIISQTTETIKKAFFASEETNYEEDFEEKCLVGYLLSEENSSDATTKANLEAANENEEALETVNRDA